MLTQELKYKKPFSIDDLFFIVEDAKDKYWINNTFNKMMSL